MTSTARVYSLAAMYQDLASFFWIAFYCSAFAYGFQWLWLQATGRKEGLPFAFSAGLFSLVTLFCALGLLSVPAVLWGQPVLFAVAATGIYRMVKGLGALRAAGASPFLQLKANWPHWVLAAIAAYCIWFWASILAEIVALPSYHDGIVHTLLFSRILDTGLPLASRIPAPFGEVFPAGTAGMPFYPSGTHVIAASFSWLPIQLGLEPTSLLKAFLLAANSAIPLLGAWAAQKCLPRLPKWIPLLVAWSLISYYPFPIWASDQGGFSRILAYGITIPAVLALLTGPAVSTRAALFAVGLPGSFLLHPGAFILFSIACGANLLFELCTRRSRRDWLLTAVGITTGVTLLVVFFLETQRNALAPALNLEGGQLAFSISALWNRLSGLLKFAFTDYFQSAGLPSLKGVLWAIGGLGFVSAARRLGAPRTVVTFCFAIMISGFFFLTLIFFSSPGIRTLGLVFFHLEPRVSETLFITQSLLLGAGAWWVTRAPVVTRINGRLPAIIAALLVFLALAEHPSRAGKIRTHFWFWFRQYHTALREEFSPLITFLKKETEPDAVLVYPMFQMDILPLAAGRSGIFRYGECPSSVSSGNCAARTELAHKALGVFQERLIAPVPDLPCAGELQVFKRPAYLVVKRDSTTGATPQSLCRDLELLAGPPGFAVARFTGAAPATHEP